jgi:hypothetical protein
MGFTVIISRLLSLPHIQLPSYSGVITLQHSDGFFSTYEREDSILIFLFQVYFSNLMMSSSIHFAANDRILFFFKILHADFISLDIYPEMI